jgi:putative ABC transport system ATP-binding protein
MAVVEVKSISKSFVMGSEVIQALKKVDFSIEEGELLSIVGPSGCGKSTLMNILGLLDVPDSGEYYLDGREVSSLTDDDRARLRNQKIGFVFQNFQLLPRATAFRNVQLPLVYSASHSKELTEQDHNRMAEAALEKVGLADRKSHKPNELSGGQRQRVAIARALVNEPKIIFADEPTGNLDSKSGTDILNLFRSLNKSGVTIILVTHDPSIAESSDRVIRLRDGEIISDQKKFVVKNP